MATIDSAQLDELTTVLEKHRAMYLYIGKSAAIIHGFADTTQDADIFVEKTEENARNVVRALEEIGFDLTEKQKADIVAGRDFVQFHNNGPFDVDLIFAPDGIETFADAWERGRSIGGHPVCSMEDVIQSKKAANRPKDRESLKRLEAFKEYLDHRPRRGERLQPLNPTWRNEIKNELRLDTSQDEYAPRRTQSDQPRTAPHPKRGGKTLPRQKPATGRGGLKR